MIKKIWAVSFSPTGSTARVAMAAASAAAEALKGNSEEAPWTVEQMDISRPDMRETPMRFEAEDLVFLAVPTYAGRVPNKIMPFIRDMVKGGGAFAVPVVTFGGRSFDDSLAELADLMAENGFVLLGGGAFVCQHTFARVAAGRPTPGIWRKPPPLVWEPPPICGPAAGWRQRTFRAAIRRVHIMFLKEPDGQPAVFLKAKPQLRTDLCTACGRCAEVCPMGSIDRDTLQAAGICIKCQACIQKCPEKARFFVDPRLPQPQGYAGRALRKSASGKSGRGVAGGRIAALFFLRTPGPDFLIYFGEVDDAVSAKDGNGNLILKSIDCRTGIAVIFKDVDDDLVLVRIHQPVFADARIQVFFRLDEGVFLS